MDERQIIHMPGQLREQVTDPLTGFAVLLERERGLHQVAGLAEEGVRLPLPSHWLAVLFLEFRLVVERVNMADATRTEDLNDPLGLGGVVGARGGIGRRDITGAEPQERGIADGRRLIQELASR